MSFNRRQFIAVGASATAGAALGVLPTVANAVSDASQSAIAAFAGDATPAEGNITLTAPEIAENGNTVPIEVSVDSPMSEESHVTEVMLLADGNPSPGIATLKFSPASGRAQASTRVRLAKTQDVIAVAKMNDGSVYMASKSVKVTIGGCGG